MVIAAIVIVGSFVWLSFGYYSGRKAHQEYHRKGWVWGVEDEIFFAIYIIFGPLSLAMQIHGEAMDAKPEPPKPREITSIFGRKDKP